MLAYEVTNMVTGSRYIGITRTSLEKRWAGHCRAAKGKPKAKSLLHDAIRKYGVGAFSVRHIASARSWQDLGEIERILIQQEGTIRPNGYNLLAGGEGGPTMLGRKLNDLQLAKLSAAKLATWASYTPERRAEIGAKVSASQRGKKKGPYKNVSHLRGVPKSPEHRAKLAAGNRARAKDPANSKAISEGLRNSEARAAYDRRRIGIAPVCAKDSSENNRKRWAAYTPEQRAVVSRNISKGRLNGRKKGQRYEQLDLF